MFNVCLWNNMQLITSFFFSSDNLCVLTEEFHLYSLLTISRTFSVRLDFFLPSYWLFALLLCGFIISSFLSFTVFVGLFFERVHFCLVNFKNLKLISSPCWWTKNLKKLKYDDVSHKPQGHANFAHNISYTLLYLTPNIWH